MLLLVVVCLLNSAIYGREFCNAATCGRVFVECCYLLCVLLNVATCCVFVECGYLWWCVFLMLLLVVCLLNAATCGGVFVECC
jgi:hypothetical protein